MQIGDETNSTLGTKQLQNNHTKIEDKTACLPFTIDKQEQTMPPEQKKSETMSQINDKTTHTLLVRFFGLILDERMCLVYTAKNLFRLLSSFLLSALLIKVTLQSSIPLCSGS